MLLAKREKPHLNLRGIAQQLLLICVEPLLEMFTDALVQVVVCGVTAGIANSGLLEKLSWLADGSNPISKTPSTKKAGRPRGVLLCSVVGCSLKVCAKGFCSKHYQASKRTEQKGNGTVVRSKGTRISLTDPTQVCLVGGCRRPASIQGLCSRHSQRNQYQ